MHLTYALFHFRLTRMEGRRPISKIHPASHICHCPFHASAAVFCALDPALVPDREDLQEKMGDSAFAPAPSMAPISHLKATNFVVQGS